MKTPKKPCVGCPYRRDSQPGTWDRSEYEKVRSSEQSHIGSVFACHGHIKKPVDKRGFCAGWLLDQRERGLPSIALRLTLMRHPDRIVDLDTVSDGGLELMGADEMVRVNINACDAIDEAVENRRRR